MMARTTQRVRAIQAVIRTGRIPGRNVKWSEFCDLVRAAARVRETHEEFPRGWSNGAIMNAAIKISRSPTVLCERCKTEIALANALDSEPDVDRRRRKLVAGGNRRVLSRTGWALFEALYAARGSPVSTDFLVMAIAPSGLREHIRRLRRALIGSRYCIETYRNIGYGLTVASR
jgi:DNA-binding response OmpR family regulator